MVEGGGRKGVDILLDAYAQDFKPSEDVLLLLSVYNRDRAGDVRHEITKLLPSRCPPVVVMVSPEFPTYQMGSLYRSAARFLLPTPGAGWGVPLRDAIATAPPATPSVPWGTRGPASHALSPGTPRTPARTWGTRLVNSFDNGSNLFAVIVLITGPFEVEPAGLEPVTSCLQSRRSPS